MQRANMGGDKAGQCKRGSVQILANFSIALIQPSVQPCGNLWLNSFHLGTIVGDKTSHTTHIHDPFRLFSEEEFYPLAVEIRFVVKTANSVLRAGVQLGLLVLITSAVVVSNLR